MYKAVVTNKGRTVKTVTVEAPENANDNDVLEAALSAAGENRSSLFGWSINYWPVGEVWTVDLHTD